MKIIDKIVKRIIRFYRFIVYTRPLYTLWFNFRYLPLSQAVKLPIIFFPHAFAKVEKGAQITISDEVLNHKSKKIMIGEDVHDFAHFSEKTYLHIAGTISFHGQTRVLRGAFIDVWGALSLGDDVLICSLVRIRTYKRISIGSHVRITHETQIFDTNFHYVVDVDNPKFRPLAKPIAFGDYVWIGNRSTINAGSVLPSYTIVASNSLVNKDLSELKPYTIVGGMPCKVLKEGKVRVWDEALEVEYLKQELGFVIPSSNPVIW